MQTRSQRQKENSRNSFYKKWWFWLGILVLIALIAQCNRQSEPEVFLKLDKPTVALNKQLDAKLSFQTNQNNKYTIEDTTNKQEIVSGIAKSGNEKLVLHNAGKFKLIVYKDKQSTSKTFTVKPLKMSQKEITATLEDSGDTALDNNNGSEIASSSDNKNVPADYQKALKTAKKYSDTLHMSKAGIYNQLTSHYGKKYSEKAATYAIDNLQTDYNYNALQKAKDYQKELGMSDSAIKEQLTSQTGDQFSDAEADYAIEHISN